jgi:hypothetical protein
MFGKHPSKELQELFYRKPYQGQDPKKARVIVLGLDANYDKNLNENTVAFSLIKEYQQDGVEFWHNHTDINGIKVHHPFLDKYYPRRELPDGVGYHRNFAKMKLSEEYAECISFVELLNVPTFGRTEDEKQFWELFKQENSEGHVKWFDSIVTFESNPKKLILLSDSVIRKMRKIKKWWGFFDWIPDNDAYGSIPIANGNQGRRIRHFSPASHQTKEQLQETETIIREFCSLR